MNNARHVYPVNSVSSLIGVEALSQHLNRGWMFEQHRIQPDRHLRVGAFCWTEIESTMPIATWAQR